VARRRGSKASTIIFVAITIALDVVAGIFFNFEDYFVTWLCFGVMALAAFIALNLHYFGRREEVDVWFELGFYGILCFAIGTLFLRYDTPALCVDASGYFQAHAIWHCFSAVAIVFVYLMLRSDMWMYDLVEAKEEKRGGAMDEAYRVPGLDLELGSSPSFADPRSASDRALGRSSRREVDAAGAGSRPRTLERDESSNTTRRRTLERGDEPQRPRTLERDDSGSSSRASSRRLDNLRAQARNNNRDSRKTQRTLDSDSELSIGAAYWTCPECAYEDNELAHTVCERCQAERPPLDEFVPMSIVQGYI